MKQIGFLFVLASLLGIGTDARAMHCDAAASTAGCSTSVFFTIDLNELDVALDAHGSATLGTLGEVILPITAGDGGIP